MVCTQYIGTEYIMKFASKALPIMERDLSCLQLEMRHFIFEYSASQKVLFSPEDRNGTPNILVYWPGANQLNWVKF
jgi:hypothetical protein